MFISIVTVVYNGEKTIRKTIESVLVQEFKDYEYIIVDGLSKDNTLNIAKEYESRFEGRLRIYSERDKGIYDAMNKGIRHAKGDYIWLVNADDWIEKDALSNIHDYVKSNDLKEGAILAGWMNIIDANTYEVLRVGRTCRELYESATSKLKMGLCHPATIVNRKVSDEVGLFDERYYISADIDFLVRCHRTGVKVVFPQLVLTNMTDGGISNQLPIKKNWHDWVLRYNKFCSNPFQKVYYLMKSITKLLLRKYLPKPVVKKLLHQ